MSEEKLRFLIDQYLNGKASEIEEAELLCYYNQLQEYKTWQDELMGDQETVKKHLFKKIINSIIAQEKVKHSHLFQLRKIIPYAAILFLIAGWLIYFHRTSFQQPQVGMLTKIAPAGGTLKIVLSDGTRVFLNNGSKITYPERFIGIKREISLTGEAYFEVTHLKKPFVVHSGKMLTQVLGTSFNIKAYEGDKIAKVSVLTGLVGVSLNGSKLPVTFVEANERVVFNKHNNAMVKSSSVDAASDIAWRQGIIKFRSTPFPEALEELNRIYHVNIVYQKQLKNCQVFADFNYKDSPGKVLNMLAKSLNGTVVNNGYNNYLITGRACR